MSTSTHLLLISRCPPWPTVLGDRLIVYHLARELHARGWQIDLLAFTDRAEDAHEQTHYRHFFRSVTLIPEPPRPSSLLLRRLLLYPERFPLRAQDSASPDMFYAIQRALAHQRYDALHLFGGIQVYEYRHALAGQPAVITPYESYSLFLARQIAAATNPIQRLAASAQAAAARAYERFMFAPWPAVTVVAEPDRRALLALNPALPVTVIPNGVDTACFAPRAVRRIPALLFVGNYEYGPNVDAALRLAQHIFPAVRAECPAAHLWLVGNAPPPELLALRSRAIRVTGRVPDVRPYLARAGVFLSPLRLGAGIKNKVLEALAMACPVVATPLSLDGIAVTEGESALAAASDADLAAAALRLLADPPLAERMGQAGRALVQAHYSWSRAATQYEALYRQVRVRS